GAEAAQEACARWEKEVSGKEDPTDIAEGVVPRAELVDGKMWICKLVVTLAMATSNTEARKAVEGGSVSLGSNRDKVSDPKANVEVVDGLIVRVGKKQVKRVRLA